MPAARSKAIMAPPRGSKNMATVLVTGASGFLGSHIVETFLEAGYRVACAVSETSQTWRLDEFVDRLNVLKMDYSDATEWARIVSAVQPDAVVHAGWQGVKGAERNELFQFDNIKSHVALADAVLLTVSALSLGLALENMPKERTDFGRGTASPTTPWAGQAVFFDSCRGRCAPLVAVLLARGFVGPKTMVGARAKCHKGSKTGEVMPFTKGNNLGFSSCKDAADAIKALVESPGSSGVFNLGSGHPVKLRDITEYIAGRVDPGIPLPFGALPREDQVMTRSRYFAVADIDRLNPGLFRRHSMIRSNIFSRIGVVGTA